MQQLHHVPVKVGLVGRCAEAIHRSVVTHGDVRCVGPRDKHECVAVVTELTIIAACERVTAIVCIRRIDSSFDCAATPKRNEIKTLAVSNGACYRCRGAATSVASLDQGAFVAQNIFGD